MLDKAVCGIHNALVKTHAINITIFYEGLLSLNFISFYLSGSHDCGFSYALQAINYIVGIFSSSPV